MNVAEQALLAVIDAVRDYLPPDGISAETFINRVIEAVDNPDINPVIRRLELAIEAANAARLGEPL